MAITSSCRRGTSPSSPPARSAAFSRWRVAAARSIASDRKSTRLNSSHGSNSYAVFCLKKKTYMDDTQWITDSQTKLEKILKIADSFYNLNDIQVNKEKSELLIKKKKIRNETFSYNENI